MSLAYKILNHYKKNSENKVVNFFLKNQTRFHIWLLSVARFDNATIKNFSFYYKNIPTHISSQININNHIDIAIEEGYLVKKKSDIDKRSTIITSTKLTDDAFNIFFKDLKSLLNTDKDFT